MFQLGRHQLILVLVVFLAACRGCGELVQCSDDDACGVGNVCTDDGLCVGQAMDDSNPGSSGDDDDSGDDDWGDDDSGDDDSGDDDSGDDDSEGSAGPEVEGDADGECRDGLDNDLDGLFDCDDPGCQGSADCAGDGDDGPITQCNDGLDNDLDGDVDLADIDCVGTSDLWEGLCADSCTYHGDGACDDGGVNSDYSLCGFGTDCTDCGMRSSCTNTCPYAQNGVCNDGLAPDSSFAGECPRGTDCFDCGPRFLSR